MIHRWDTMEEYGYGYIIPFLALFLIWQRKNILAEKPFEPTFWAIPFLLLSGVIYFVGTVATTHTLTQYALVFTILGMAYGLLGWDRFKIVAIPIVLLFFMVPLPPFIYNNLSGKLQLISSELGVAVIRMFGISVYLEGNVIDLGAFKLQVVEACSGLRYLFPLVSLSFIAAYFYNVETWKKVVVFLSSVPITVFMNSFRIGVIGVLVEYYGIEQAEGFLHDFEGWFIFMACMAILFIEMTILAHIGQNKRKLIDVFGIDLPEPIDENCDRHENKITSVHYALVATLALYTISSSYIQQREDIQLARSDFYEFPDQIGDWKGSKQKLEENILKSLKTDDYIISDYQNGNGDRVNFYVAYYADQQAGSAAHSPRACIPGGGWQIKDLQTINVDGVTMAGQPLSTNRLLIKKGDYTQVVYYWFQQRNRIITNEYLVKWYLFWDALNINRTDGALVRLTTISQPSEDLELADKRLVEFARLVQPLMSDFIPE
jgi:exosortase D (VPLPA-CTERM-specific)